MNSETLERLMQQLADLFGREQTGNREEMKSMLAATLKAGLARMNLVTREEFEAQTALLARTREKLDSLEAQLSALEAPSD